MPIVAKGDDKIAYHTPLVKHDALRLLKYERCPSMS